MSGAAGGTRIPRSAVEQTVKDFVSNILSKIPGFKSAKISGSYNQPVKQDFGDIDLIVSIETDLNKKEVKKMIVDYFEGLSDRELPYLNSDKYKNKKAINHGEIISNLYPISGMPGEFVQVDNIIAVSESEGEFKKVILDYPAELQGLILGLVKTPLLEEEPEQVFKRMGIKDVPSLGPNQEYEFHLDTSGLSLKIVTLDENYRQLDSNIVWESSSFDDVRRLLKDFNLDGTFEQFIENIKKFKNPRSKNRVKGFFKTSIKVGSAEAGTPKGDGKQKALDTIAALEEKYGAFTMGLIRPLLLLEQEGTIAIFPGKFKPPHKDHLARIQAAAKVSDQVRVIIAPKPVARPDEAAVSAQESLAIFNLYKKKNLVPDNVTFEISDINSPVSKAYMEFEANPDQKYIAVFGKEESEKFKGTEKLPNVTINQFPEANIGKANASDLRIAIANNDIAAIKEFIPFGVSPAEYLHALHMPVKEPMSEGKSIKKLRVFDFDDTLAHIKALIRITHQDGSKEELTPAEYAVYNPQPGDKFNFSDFNKVIRQAHPIENNVQDLIRSYNDPTEKTTILTARMLGYPVKKYLRDEFGIEPYVVGLGSADPMDKARWIEQQIHKGYNDIEFRDDSKKNVDAVATLQDKYPDVRLTSMLVESYKGKRTSDGAPGTLKAKISKLYGGDVTIAKAKKLKSRENATPHDKRQANWFINFHSKNENIEPSQLKNTGKSSPYGSEYRVVEEDLSPYITSLTKHMYDQGLTIDPAPSIEFIEDEDNAMNPLGKTAYYDPNQQLIVVYTTGRHPKDILRSFAHEMIHHCQNLEGRLGDIQTTDINEDDRLKELEREAYQRGNMYFRGWENSMRGDNGVRYIKGFAPNDGDSEPIIAEGRYDLLTNKLSKLAFAAFKTIHDRGDKKGTFSFIVGPKSEYEEEQPDIQSDEFEFDFNGIVVITKDLYVVDGGANVGFDNEGDEIQPVIQLNFKIPKNPDWQKVSFDIKDVVRHELEHLTQDGLNLKGYVDIDDPRAKNDPKLTRLGKYMEDDQFFRDQIDMDLLPKANYFRLQKEIDAMLQGMYFKAKKSRQPFADVLNNYLDMQSISEEDKENILNLWRNRAKSLSLPKF